MAIVINSNTGEIDVAASTPGTYRITYTTNGDCPNSSTQDITINALPTISISASSTSICAGDSVTLTASGAGAGGSYSWSDGQTTAAITVTPGATITYSVTGTDANGCFNTADQQITVTPLDVATVVYDSSSYCQVPTGALAVDGYYPLYSTESASNAVSSDGTSHSHVLGGVTYYMPNAGVVMYHDNYSLTATPAITGESGTFNSPTGLSINTQTGVIDKNASTAGTYTVEYTTNGSCPITVSNTITINDLDNASMSYGASEYCQDDATDPSPTKSSTGVFSSSTGLVFANSSTGEIDLDASTAGTYKIGFVTNGTCPNSGPLQSVTLTAREDATFSYSAGSYCQNANDPTPTITGTTGGTFSSTTGLSINSTTGEINLGTSTVGSYVVLYTTPGTCFASSTQNVTVAAVDVVSLSYPSNSYPQTGTDPSPTFSPQNGGTFSAAPVGLSIDSSTGEIDLSESEIDSYTITYTSGGTCPGTATFNLSITSVSAAFNYSASAYCQDASDPTPTVTGTSGGTFSAAPLFTGLLDTYTGSQAAYSLRRLSSTYTGNLIRVTKKVSTVISETDIGYNSSNELDTAALATFASGADNGEVRVVIWYDQSGNSNNVTHSTYTQLPKIYESGSLITENSKPALRVARSTLATTGTPISSQQSSIFYVTKVLSGNNSYDRIFSIGTSSSGYFAQLNTIASPQPFTSWYNGTLSIGGDLNSQRLITFYNDSTTQYLRQDGVQIDSDSKTPSSYGSKDLILFGDTNTNKALVGIYQEFIFYPSEQSSNLTGIETNIKNYHGI